MSRYQQRDRSLGVDTELSVWWALLQDNPKLDTNATIKYTKKDGTECSAWITREKDVNHPLGWKVIAHNELKQDDGVDREVMLVTGGTAVWEEKTETMRTLPDNRLDIELRTNKGNSFLGITANYEFGLVVFQRGKWIIYNKDGIQLEGPVKVLSVKIPKETDGDYYE